MVNQEHLKLAAKAVGRISTENWNPWDFMGDALELAMELNMQVAFNSEGIAVNGMPCRTKVEFRVFVARQAVEKGRVM